MLRRLYDWTMSLAAGPRASLALGAVSFAESSIFPIPPDLLLIPMVLADRARAWGLALLCTVMSVMGGLAGYAIGALLFTQIAEPILAFYGYLDAFQAFQVKYNAWGAWAVLVAGVTPFPFKVITIASGATGLDLVVFVIASIVARGIRFFAVAGLLYAFGPPIRTFIEKRLGLVFTVFVVMLLAGFAAIKLL
ncbi:membrane protein YqaA with SNARE-associated domain [Breoghania corrubedonensis]|uniref:Membrane protein YqaA with SNARE-associated domain n=1 Tax=Breoghania corrubedonensis TaxID=665038 RepID=A0A2T5V5P9_9HYPH|nr:YqaA family protein [Breoghania corrubedonensis]PTW59079.1 membrane protein YqaA with SNARE-associated domain [Breoghania corrubedonensis]